MDVQVAEVVVSVRGHALAAYHLNRIYRSSQYLVCLRPKQVKFIEAQVVLTWRDSLARENVDAKPALIQVFNVNGATSKSRDQLNFTFVKQIILLSSKARMGFLLNLKNDVTSLNTGCLVTLASKFDLGSTSDALIDVNVEYLSVDNRLLAGALLAAILIFDDLALTIAVRTYSLEALDHGTHLAHHGLHTVAITARAFLDRAVLASQAVALGTDDGSLQGQLGDLSPVDVLKRDLVSVLDGASFGGAAIVHAAEHATHAAEATAAEELSEQVFGSHAATAGSAALKTSFTILVVDLSLLSVGQDLVGVGNFFELFLSGGVVCVLVCVWLLDRGTVVDMRMSSWG